MQRKYSAWRKAGVHVSQKKMDVDDPFLQTRLDDWCQKAIVDQKHTVILLGVPADLEVAHIEETVQAVKALGRVRVGL